MALTQFAGAGRGGAAARGRIVALGIRLWPAVALFLAAAGADLLTEQRYSSVWGSLAIVGSIVAVIPASRSLMMVIAAYGAVWGSFNVGRAFADNASPGWVGLDAVSRAEMRVFGGSLPSERLQEWGQLLPAENALAILPGVTYMSFFVAPFAMALLLWHFRPAQCWRFLLASALAFGCGLPGFLLAPTAPPWMSDPAHVRRVFADLLIAGGVRANDGIGGTAEVARGFWFEPNHLAALPSIHVAVAVLIFLAVRDHGPCLRWLGMLYAVAMSVSVVYLGEHFVLDVAGGWLVAYVGWQLAGLGVIQAGGFGANGGFVERLRRP